MTTATAAEKIPTPKATGATNGRKAKASGATPATPKSKAAKTAAAKTPAKTKRADPKARRDEALRWWRANPKASFGDVADYVGIPKAYGSNRGLLLLRLVESGDVKLTLAKPKPEPEKAAT